MSEWESELEDEEESSSKVHGLVRKTRFGKCQYGYTKGPYYMVKPGPMPPREHNKMESKKLHKLGTFPKLRAAGRAARKTFC